MEISQEMMTHIEAKYSGDFKQDLYLKLLEITEDAPPFESSAELSKWIGTLAWNASRNKLWMIANRERLLKDNLDAIRTGLGMSDAESADPCDIVSAQEEIKERVTELSDLNTETFHLLYHIGLTAQEVADLEGVEVNAIYQRIYTIKELLKGE